MWVETILVDTGSPVKDDERVILFPTAAYRAVGKWHIPIHGWIFEPEATSRARALVRAAVAELLGADADPEVTPIFNKRLSWFLVDNERHKRLLVRVGQHEVTMGRSEKDGHFRGHATLPGSLAQRQLETELVLPQDDPRTFAGQVFLIPNDGLSVISDIDDTIKHTEVRAGTRRVMERTLMYPYQEVEGMPSLLRSLAERGAFFHYVSASPWQLYRPLQTFFASSGIPDGTFHLRPFRFKERAKWSVLRSSRPHKLATIRMLLARYNRRRFVLVGDTGESDPEIYGQIAREHPQQIAAILLRRAPGDQWNAERYNALQDQLTMPIAVGDIGALAATSL